MVRGICVWNKTSTGICRSRLTTYSSRPRQGLNVMPSFSAKAWIVAHISPLMLFKVISMSVRKVDSHQSYWSWWLYITSCITFHTASASERSQVLDMWWDPARLGTVGVRLPGPTAGYPGKLKLRLVYIEASDCLLSSDIVHHCLGQARPKGVEVMEGGNSSVTSLWEPIGLQRPSNTLELMGRVELSVQVSSV